MRKASIIGGIFLVALISVLLLRVDKKQASVAADCLGVRGTCDVRIEFATDQQAREKGLSGRDSLATNHGMLFVFTTAENQCMWMKDMKFNLDIIWLSNLKTVTHIEKNVAPSTYPKSFCASAKYILELPAGDADKLGITNYKQLTFVAN